MVRVIAFLRGPIALHGLVHFLNTTGPSLTKEVCAYFVRIMYIYINNIIYYTYTILYIIIYILLNYAYYNIYI